MQSKMKKIFLVVFSIAFLSGSFPSKVFGQTNITATAIAQVIAALTATEISQLNFGRFSPETQGGVLLLTPDGVLTTQGTVIPGGGAHSSASFNITGEPNATCLLYTSPSPRD